MSICVELVDYSVLVNNKSVGFVILVRGLCQRESLSPHLFIICADLSFEMLKIVMLLMVLKFVEVYPQCFIFSLPMIVSYSLKLRRTKLK
jgi:predicted benzoate:H+ symporter BenE